MMTAKTYEYFVQDLIFLLKERIEETSDEQNVLPGDKLYKSGEIFSLYSVLNLIKSQAVAFGIPLEELQLADYNLERFLIMRD